MWPRLQEEGEEERGALRAEMRILIFILRLLCVLCGKGPLGEQVQKQSRQWEVRVTQTKVDGGRVSRTWGGRLDKWSERGSVKEDVGVST